jgi:hypothetical protein
LSGLAFTLAACATSGSPSESARVSVVGPLPQTEASHAFAGAAYTERPEDLGAVGYVEAEYLVSGEANVYDWPAPGPAIVRTPDAPYTTRVLVRQPAAREDFSGRVVVEMLNPSNLMDLNIGWAIMREELVRSGDAWVGITAKPVAVETLQTFDPERYASLAWPNPLSSDDPRNCEVAGGGDSRDTENGLVWDINTQVAEWIESRDPSNPFLYGGGAGARHPVERLYGWGYSQTGGFLFTYINAIRPLVVAQTGEEPFDGYLLAVIGSPLAINQCGERVPADDPRRVIRDAGAPVMYVMSQSDYLAFGPVKREDSDVPGDQFRHYDIAGAGHATPEELWYGPRAADIVKGGRAVPAMECVEGPRSRFPSSVGFNAIYRNLRIWAEGGPPPPPSQYIQVEEGEPVLDAHGNVQGGVRSPLLDVPTSTWTGTSTGASFCFIAGHETLFTAEELARLYPSQAAYEAAFAARTDELVGARFITPEDGEALKEESRRTVVR